MKKIYHQLILSLFVVLPLLGFSQGSGHGAAAAYITTATEPWGQTSNISALNAVYGSSGWNKYIYGADANVSNIFSNTRSLVFIEGGNGNTTAMKNFLDANWSTINTWVSGGRTLIVSAATNESLGKFQIGSSGVYSERILTNNMVAYSNATTYPHTTSNVHPLLRTNVTINGVTGDAYFSGNYYGNYVAHNVITGEGLNSIFTVSGTTDKYTLAEKTIGTGRMLVGGLTLPWFITVQAWQPQPQMTRLMYAMLGWVQAVSNPAPSISTSDFTNLGTTSVTTGGSSIGANGETITAKGVAYSTSQNPTTSSSTVSGGSGTADFSVNITNLTPNTLYYARAYATSPTGTGYGNQISFRTLPINPTNATSSAGTTICSGSFTNLNVSNAEGTVYWYTDADKANFVGTGNPRSVNPSVSTTYYAWNNNGNFSTGNTSIAITVQQPASQPATANVVVPAAADGLTTANLSWSQSTGDGTITYYWSVGETSTSSYESGYTARGTTTYPTITATAAGLTKSTAYYLSVKAVNNCGTSVYRRSAIFRTNNERIYQAGANGTVGTTSAGGQSSLTQFTAYNTNGSVVYAVPNSGYNFVNWSDGVTVNPRTDNNVTTSVTLTANFAPNRLAFVTQPATKRAGETIPVSVRITDTYGNTMTNATANITLTIETNPSIGAAGVLNGTVTIAAVSGVATFNDLWINKTGNGYTLKASSPSPIVTQPVSSAFNIIPAADVNYFTLDGITTPHQAGEFTSPTVTAYDVYDNVKYDYTGTVTFSTNNVSINESKPTVMPANYTFQTSDNGIKTFTNQVNLKRYGTGYYVRVNDGTAQGEQTNIQVTSAPLNFYTIKANSNYPTHPADNNVLAGTVFSATAYLYDEFGNLKLDFTGPLAVTFTTNANPSPLGNPSEIPSAGDRTFTEGVCTISGFTFYNAQETPTITIVESMTGSAGTTPVITVWPEVLANFLVKEQPVQNHGIGGVRVISNESFSVKVTARDRYNNIKRDYLGYINFKSSNDAIVDFPDGLQQFLAGDKGIRTFTNAISIPTTGSYWLRVADSPDAFKTGELQNIVVGPNVQNAGNSELFFTSHPSLTTYPSTPEVVAGDFINVTIRPRDAGNNLLCDCRNVIIYLNGVDKHRTGAPVLGVPALETIVVTDHHDGSYTASIRVTDMSQTNSITASVNGTPLDIILQVTINEPAAPSLLVSTLNAASNTITTDQSTLITLQLKDEFANNRMSNDGTMTFSTTLGGFGTNNGTMEVNAAYLGGTTGTYTATLYASYSAVNHGVGNAAITVSANFSAESHTDGNFDDNEIVAITEGLPNLVTSTITANPTEITTDESSLITLQLKDHLGNLIQNNRGVATLISDVLGELSATTYLPNGKYVATLSGDVRPINGVGIAIITGSFAGVGTASEVTGYFNDGGSPANNTAASVRITQGLPDVATIQIVANPITMTTDESSIITVTLYDHLGNLIINSRGTVALTTTLGAISAVTDNDNGTYTATLTGNATGTGNATISGTIVIDNIGDAVAIIDNAQVTITEGLPNLLTSTITASHSSITTDESSVITVQLKDQFGNNIVNNRGAVIISTDLGALSSTSYDSHGKYIATLTGNNTGTGNATLSATLNIDNGGTAAAIDDTETVSITEGLPALSQIEITASPVEITADETSTITVQFKDQWGNLLTTSRGTITLATNPIGVVSVVTDNANGTYTAIFSLNAYGTGTATITGLLSGEVVGSIADNATVEVSHGVATQLAIDQQPSAYVRAGDFLAQQPIISIRDTYGNLVDDDATQITASANGSAQLVGTRAITASNGLVSYSGLNYEKMEVITIGFTSVPELTPATSNGITVDHNKTHRFEFTSVPAFIYAGGERGAYTVKRYDAYGNLVNNLVVGGSDSNDPETVYLYTDGSTTSPFVSTFHSAATAGSVITSINIVNTATTANFWYYSTDAGDHLITGSDVTPLDNPDATVLNAVHNTLEVRPAALSHFIVSGIGTDAPHLGAGWTEHYYGDVQTVTVEAIDILGNRKTNYTGKITFNLTDAQAAVSTNYPVDYTFTAGDGLDNGIHTFTNSILFTRPSFEHPDYPNVNEWWVTVVDQAQPSKYGSQVKIKVLARPITITAHDQTKYYYGETHSLGSTAFTVSSGISANAAVFAGNESISNVQLSSTGTVATATVGNYAIIPSNPTPANNLNLNYYSVSYQNGTLNVERRPITIATTGTQTKVYGENDPAGYGYSVTSTLGLTAWDQWSGVLRREAGENVGFYDMLINGSSLTIVESANPNVNKADNYDISFVNTNQFEITRKPITLTPVASQSKTYGDVNPVYTYTTNPTINTVLANGHSVALTGALTRESGENVGTYKILQGNIDNSENTNYAVTFTEDVLFTINRLPFTVTANTGQTKIYGQLDPLPFTFTADPVIGHELANGLFVELNGTLSREAGENVGLYAIQQNTVNNNTNPNYDVSYSGSNFEITRRPITVTAVAEQYKTYGDLDPIFAYTTTVDAIGSTLPNGHIVSLIGALTRDAGEVVDLYNILQGTITNTTNPNYNITITPEVKFEIERKDIAIYVSGDQSKIYGENNPTYAYTTTPALGDLPFNAAFVGALVRQTGENVASNYTITQGTLELGDDNNGLTSLSQNYNVSFTGADFEITRKAIAITVIADQQKVYGETDPAFAFTTVPALASLPFQAASWTGSLVREAGEVVGDEYTITRGTLELIDGHNPDGNSLATNYTVTFTPADFEITRKPITITVDAIAKTYGDNDPGFTFDSSPLLASLPFNAAWTGNLVRLNTNENVAAYAITQGSLELTDNNNGTASLAQNYTLNFVGNNLTINKRNITIIVASDQQKVYAETDPVFTYSSSVDPLYFGGSFTGALSRAGGENVADYAIGRGTLQIVDNNNETSLDANYNLNFVAANFAITKKPITITVVEGQNKRYGFNDPVTSPAAPIYFRDYEFVSSVNPLPFDGDFIGTLQHTGVSSSPVGSYPINRGTLNINDFNNNTTSLDANYQITFAGSNFTINERLLTISATDQTKTYGFGPEWGVGQPDNWTLGSTEFSVSTDQGDGLAYSETITGVQFSSTGETRFAFVGDYGVSIVAGSAIGTNGFALSNYQFSYEGAELTILHRILNLSNFAADNKVYDGNTTATGLGFNDNRVPGDNLAFTRTAAFENADAGAGKTVVYNSVIISGGAHKDNYVLETETSHWKTPANRKIDPKPLSITANTFTKYLGELYTFTGDEFQTSEMVTGETIQSVSLQSAGSPVGASIGSYNIEISNPIAAAGTLLANYEIELHNGLMHVVDPMTIAGKVFYYQKFSFIEGTPVRQDLPMQGVTVKLHHTGGVSTTTTSIDGEYTFTQINASTVTKVEVEANLPWGSVSANDALAMQLRIVQSPPLYWQIPFNINFMDYIADVNNNNFLTIQDVLGTKHRILNPSSPTFLAGNWRFYAEDLNFVPLNKESDNSASLPNPIMNGGFYPNIYARVVGDMDGDYNPNPSKSLIPIQEGEALVVSSGELFGLDIRLRDVLDFAAMSLTLQFDDNKVQVESISSTLSGYEYRIEGNEIRMVWTSLSGLQLNAKDLLLTLNMRTIAPVYWYDNILFMNSNTVFGNMFADMIGNVEVIAPYIDNTVTDLIGFDANKLNLRSYPNPFNDWATISYDLPANARVNISLVNMMGVTIRELVDEHHMRGTYTYRYNAKHDDLGMGVYYVRMTVNANGNAYSKILRIVHIE